MMIVFVNNFNRLGIAFIKWILSKLIFIVLRVCIIIQIDWMGIKTRVIRNGCSFVESINMICAHFAWIFQCAILCGAQFAQKSIKQKTARNGLCANALLWKKVHKTITKRAFHLNLAEKCAHIFTISISPLHTPRSTAHLTNNYMKRDAHQINFNNWFQQMGRERKKRMRAIEISKWVSSMSRFDGGITWFSFKIYILIPPIEH